MKYFILLFLMIIMGAGVYYLFENKDQIDIPYLNEKKDISEMIENSTDKGKESETVEVIDNNNDSVEEGVLISQGPLMIPEGFTIDIFAKNLGKVRVLKSDPNGNILASITDQGRILLLNNDSGSLRSGTTSTLVSDLDRPHGIALKCDNGSNICKLFIAENSKVLSYDYDIEKKTVSGKRTLFELPTIGNHYTRTIEIVNINGEDLLLTSVGSTCNVCDEKDWRNAAILSSTLDGNNLKPFAVGLRNTVFYEINPMTNELWGTDMGRDWLGDDLPPDEINIIRKDEDYGWPVCYGKNIHDSDYDTREFNVDIEVCDALNKTPSHINLQAHSAPLGIEFIEEETWNGLYKNHLLVAQHGSWNRDIPVGYKIISIELDDSGNEVSRSDFITGWFSEDGVVLGRPVDILNVDNNIYISDDKAGVIYVLKRQSS